MADESRMIAQPASTALRVLIPCNRVPDNPYLFQLIRALDADPGIATVQHDTDWLRFPETRFDVVHIQWPEALAGWREPSAAGLAQIERTLAGWRGRGTLIAVTAHNTYPHGRNTAAFQALYRIVYQQAHLVVHFGARSIGIVGQQYPDAAANQRHVVIPHGNYDWFVAGQEPLVPPPALPFRLLCFGRIRSAAELALIETVADALADRGGKVVVVGRLPHPSRLSPAHYRLRYGLWRRRNVRLVEGYATDDAVRRHMREAHGVLIARSENLNSGNVPLAFTFGRVAVGPDIGVIGEELAKTGNPIFDPSAPSTIRQALDRAIELAATGHGERNRNYAQTELAWRRIAQLHREAYKACLHSDENSSTLLQLSGAATEQ